MGKKTLGYILAAIGLLGLGLVSPIGKKILPSVENLPQQSIIVGSLCFVILGVLIVSIFGDKGKKEKQAEKEVPIYKGEGKHRRIVGYKVDE